MIQQDPQTATPAPETRTPPAPRVTLPPKIPVQLWRPVQSNIPADRGQRDRIKQVAAELEQLADLAAAQAPRERQVDAEDRCAHASIMRGAGPRFQRSCGPRGPRRAGRRAAG